VEALDSRSGIVIDQEAARKEEVAERPGLIDEIALRQMSQAANPPQGKYVDLSGKAFNTVGSNSYSFYEDLDQLVQEEPADSEDPELLGQLLAIGIQKGKAFAPDERMKKILTDAAAVGIVLWLAKMSSQAKSLRISNIRFEVQ
jgi:hypothetical protein